MAIAGLLAGGLFHGDAGDGSVLAIFLIGGALLGAAGGALSASGGTAPQRAEPHLRLDVTRPTGFEPVTSRSGGARSIH